MARRATAVALCCAVLLLVAFDPLALASHSRGDAPAASPAAPPSPSSPSPVSKGDCTPITATSKANVRTVAIGGVAFVVCVVALALRRAARRGEHGAGCGCAAFRAALVVATAAAAATVAAGPVSYYADVATVDRISDFAIDKTGCPASTHEILAWEFFGNSYRPAVLLGLWPVPTFIAAVMWARLSAPAGDAGVQQQTGVMRLAASFYALTASKLRIAGGLLAALLLSGAIGIGLLSRWSMLCNYHAGEFRRLCDFGHAFEADVNAAVGAPALWLTDASLLGVYRPANRRTNCFITNDHDLDMCISKADFPKMLAYLRSNSKYFFAYWSAREYEPGRWAQKVRVYPTWVGLHTGHSGTWCIDVDECGWREGPVVEIDGCNGRRWGVTNRSESVAYFAETYGAGWEVPVSVNHYGACALFPGL